MILEAEIGLRRGDLDLDVTIAAEAGETVAVLGPNGSGKSTLVSAVSGLCPIDRGHITLDGMIVEDPAAASFVPPEKRPIGVVFQEHRLFPHLDAADNVAFGLRCRKVPAPQARSRAMELLASVGMEGRGDEAAANLSGGERQRVAIARALAVEPRLLLLDEPFAALDAGTRGSIRRELRRQFSGMDGSRILVTHDPLDAFALADRVIVIEGGRVIQAGHLGDVTSRPRSRYVADLVGVNLFAAVASGTDLALEGGGRLTSAETASGDVFVLVHPRSIAIHRSAPEGSARNVWRGTVEALDLEADRTRVRITGQVDVTAEITTRSATDLDLRPGEECWLSLKATEVEVYPR